MKLLSIYGENIFSYKILDLNLEPYSNGTTIMLGANLDMNSPNGAGKSAILRSIYLVLFGKDLKNVGLDNIIHAKHKKEGFVLSLTYIDNKGALVRATRYYKFKREDSEFKLHNGKTPKGSGVEVIRDGKVLDANKDQNVIKKWISDSIGNISGDIFLNSVMTPQQRKKPSFLDSADGNRKDLLSDIQNLQFYDEAHKLVTNDINDNTSQIEQFQKTNYKNKELINELKNSNKNIDQQLKNFVTQQTNKKKQLSIEINNLKKEIKQNQSIETDNKIDDKIKNFKEKRSNLQKEIVKLENDLKKESSLLELKAQQDTLLQTNYNQIENKENEAKALEKEIVTSSNIKFDTKELESLKNERKQIESQIEEFERNINVLSTEKEQQQTIEEQIQFLENQNLSLEKDLINPQNIIKKIQHDAKCETCSQPIQSNELQNKIINEQKQKIDSLNNSIQNNNEQLNKLKSQIKKDLLNNIKKLERTLVEQNKLLKEKNYKIHSLDIEFNNYKNKADIVRNSRLKIENNKKTIEDLKTKNTKIKENLSKINKSFNIIKDTKLKLNKVKIEYNAYEHDYEELLKEKEKYNKIVTLLKNLNDKLNQKEMELNLLSKEQNPYGKLIEDNNKKIGYYKKEIIDNEHKMKELNEEKKYLLFWLEGFSKTGVKSFETDKAIDLLNEKIKSYLSIISNDTLSIEFNSEKNSDSGTSNKITAEFMVDGQERHIDLLSGGEYQRANIAVDFAMSDIAESTSEFNFNIKFIDEIFKFLGENDKIQALALCNKIAENKQGFFIISHDTNIQNFCDYAIYVVKENGYSKIVSKEEFLNAKSNIR